jgi:DNA anti-recombination protein RmuC
MIGAVLLCVVLADVFIVLAFLRLQRRQSDNQQVVRELTEERGMLTELRSQIRAELQATQNQVRTLKDQVQLLATEAEQEVRQGVAEITREVDVIISNISQKLDSPMRALNEKQHFLTQLSKDAKKERELLARVVARAENAATLLKAGDSWEDVVDQLEARRFADIRALLARGVQPDRIAKDLGVSEQEVRLISGTP